MINIFNDLTIVFLLYKSEDLIIDQLDKLKDFKIIIIDNNSNYNFKKSILNKYKNIISYKVSKNIGFGKGNNQAIDYCKTKYILFLNPDLTIDSNSIRILLNTFTIIENVGVVGPMLYNTKYEPTGNSSIFPEKKKIILRNKFEKKIFNKLNDTYNNGVLCCDQIWGACMLFETSFFKIIGGFDKDFFMFYEDTYVCNIIKKHKKLVIENANATAIHLAAKSGNYSFIDRCRIIFNHKLSEYIYLNKLNISLKKIILINLLDYMQRFLVNFLKLKFRKSYKNLLRIFSIIIFLLNKNIFKKYG